MERLSHARLDSLFQSDRNNAYGDTSDVPVLLVPEPIWKLILSGCLQEVLLLVRWHDYSVPNQSLRVTRIPPATGPLPDWPPASARVWDMAGQCDALRRVESPYIFEHQSLQYIKDSLCSLAPFIRRSIFPAEVNEHISILEGAVGVVDS